MRQRNDGLRRSALPGSNRRRLLLFGIVLPLLLFLIVLGVLSGRTWKVSYPPQPEDPRLVYITDYGWHSRLAIQVDDTHMLEYGFGDWAYYAARERGVWRAIVALFVPTEAGFGRRVLPFTDEVETFNRIARAKRSGQLIVEQAAAEELLAELDARYRKNIETEFQTEGSDFTFVKDDLPYHLFHNSNQRTAHWLQRLGCKIKGRPILSNFRIENRESPPE